MDHSPYSNIPLFIAGRWREGADGRSEPIVDPASGEVVGSVAHATEADLDEALAAAARGFEQWRQVPALERGGVMRRAAALLRERAETIARLMTIDQGKPLREARLEIAAAADVADWFAEEARRTYGRIVPPRLAGVEQLVVKEPVGPVAAFTPWNFPVNQIARKLCAALAAGCSMIIKGPEETPASPAEFVRCFVDAGLPGDVVGLVYGIPSAISAYLVPHPVIRKITFTGSTPVGKTLAALAGAHMKRATMELGGHAPAIVCADADLGRAAAFLAAAKFRNAGQVCVAPTRFLIERSVYEPFLEAFAREARSRRLGSGLDEASGMGPLISARRRDAVETLVRDAVDRGAEVRAGGGRHGNHGFFFEPTVLSGATIEMAMMNEEPFGPIAMVLPFSDLSEAIVEANRLPYGLASYAFTRSLDTAAHLGRAVQAGMLSLNGAALGAAELPFGGVKDSGYGSEGGTEAMDAYLQSKLIARAA